MKRLRLFNPNYSIGRNYLLGCVQSFRYEVRVKGVWLRVGKKREEKRVKFLSGFKDQAFDETC